MVSVLPPGIDVRKLQRSHSRDKSGRAFILFTKPSFFRFTYPVYLSDLACSHHTLSDISLDRSEVKSDKLLDVNAALDGYDEYTHNVRWSTRKYLNGYMLGRVVSSGYR